MILKRLCMSIGMQGLFCKEFEVEMVKNVFGHCRQWENAFFYRVIVR